MKIKTSDLSGIALDWAVAKCEGISFEVILYCGSNTVWSGEGTTYSPKRHYRPSSDWSQGGPIIERQGIWLGVHSNDECGAWYPMHQTYYGTTYLEAAMRCYVASKLGEEVEIPEELLS